MDPLTSGRAAYERKAWDVARREFEAAPGDAFTVADHYMLAIACYMAGDALASVEAWSRGYRLGCELRDFEAAGRAAHWASFVLLFEGEAAQATGWLGRARRCLDEVGEGSALHGFVRLPEAVRDLQEGRLEAAIDRFSTVLECGERSGDVDLQALAAFGRGQAMLGIGRLVEGAAQLDEAMVAVTAREVSPLISGLVYCGVIAACREVCDVARAQEWTEALSRWCDDQTGQIAYRGQCLVHRAELMQLRGDWPAAMEEVQRAVDRLSDPPTPALGDALYQQADLFRVRGQIEQASTGYRLANQWGRSPQPGLALLTLSERRPDAAVASLQRALEETPFGFGRFRLLGALVEVALGAGDLQLARASADELTSISRAGQLPYLRALAAQADGAVLMREGEPRSALGRLREASTIWQDIGAPYEVARIQMLLGEVCRDLGDDDGAQLEFGAARAGLEALGAEPELLRLATLLGKPQLPGGLTPREAEVLRLVATGSTNRAIAKTLVISEKTVARHVSNIFTKLGLSSRSAATAYAHRHHLA